MVTEPESYKRVVLKDNEGYIVPWINIATAMQKGLVKPDGKTITIDKNGVLSLVAGGGVEPAVAAILLRPVAIFMNLLLTRLTPMIRIQRL